MGQRGFWRWVVRKPSLRDSAAPNSGQAPCTPVTAPNTHTCQATHGHFDLQLPLKWNLKEPQVLAHPCVRFQTGTSSEHSQHRNLPQVLLSPALLPKSLHLEFKDKIPKTSPGLGDAELLQNTLKPQFTAEEHPELQRQWGRRQDEWKGRTTPIKTKPLQTQPLPLAYFVYSFFKFHIYVLLCLSWNCTSRSSFESFY